MHRCAWGLPSGFQRRYAMLIPERDLSICMMNNPAQPICIAVDLGASSGRVAWARPTAAGLEISIVHRFPNQPAERAGRLYWDLEYLEREIFHGLRLAATAAPGPIAAIGMDGWAVDYVWLDAAGHALRPPYCYRDARTEMALPGLQRHISDARLYALTGCRTLRFNTLYQLYADVIADGIPEGAVRWLTLPEYFLHRLGARPVMDSTMATHTQMLQLNRQWSAEIFAAAGLALTAAPEVVPAGCDLGNMSPDWRTQPAFSDTRLIAPACHDTAAAIAGLEAEFGLDAETAYLISGTWSLLGCALPEPLVTEAARATEFTNQGGVEALSPLTPPNRIYFLKNINGLWLWEECLRAWREAGRDWPRDELLAAVRAAGDVEAGFDVHAPELLLPGHMPERICRLLAARGIAASPGPDAAPRLTALIFASLAQAYAGSLRQLSGMTGRRFCRLIVAGGGVRNHLLNQLVGERTGLEIVSGPAEPSLAGNAGVQLHALQSCL